jgi:hypothetical protein
MSRKTAKTIKTIVLIHNGKRYNDIEELLAELAREQNESVEEKEIKETDPEDVDLLKIVLPKLQDLPSDVLKHIFGMIRDGVTYKSVLFSCKDMHTTFIGFRDFFCNHLMTLILNCRKTEEDYKGKKKSPPKKNKYNTKKDSKATLKGIPKWNWYYITKNTNITMDIIQKYKDNPICDWEMDKIYENPNLTIDVVVEKYEKSVKLREKYKKPKNIEDDESDEDESDEDTIYPHQWSTISKNRGIKIHDIEAYPDFPWKWDYISSKKGRIHYNLTVQKYVQRQGITIGFVKRNIRKKWDWGAVSANRAITMDIVEKEHLLNNIRIVMREKYEDDESRDDYSDISIDLGESSDGYTPSYAESKYKWDWDGLLRNPNLTIEFIRKYVPNPELMCTYYWKLVTKNPGITMKDIEDNMDLPWVWAKIIKNPNFTEEFLFKYLDSEYVTKRDQNTINAPRRQNDGSDEDSIISEEEDAPRKRKNDGCAWRWPIISAHKGISMRFINDHPQYNWSWNHIWTNPNLNINFLVEHIKDKKNVRGFLNKPLLKKWNWDAISCHPNIKLCDIEKYPNIPWVWEQVSKNPNLTYDFVMKNIDKDWKFSNISMNTFAGTRLM